MWHLPYSTVENTPSTCGKRIICLHETHDVFGGFRPSVSEVCYYGQQ
ncbi:hypothetical protein BACCELL_00073 [Bacteroides cellulosilyticus DSM 14838]|uniref:Uncharacterized protein n=1 Tax=Bacteroides cellulosilyticus DSM 14838 TaxID=537012 RepID=E2N731_9BACE|nr:hypothetical protein BACCELL_00073 [Bacteroides cellulosilyticus DSM 14838]